VASTTTPNSLPTTTTTLPPTIEISTLNFFLLLSPTFGYYLV
jgi:hypothetical protein